MKTIRAFIAVEIPDDVKRIATDVGRQLAASTPDGAIRWVKPNAMHLTLRFLGNTDEQLLPDISRVLDVVVALPVFSLRLDQLGAFPNTKRPRALWLGLLGDRPDDVAALATLKAAIDRGLEPLDWPVETKPFQPHLTLGRVREGRSPGDVPWQLAVPETVFPVTAIHAIESDLLPVDHATRSATQPNWRLRVNRQPGPGDTCGDRCATPGTGRQSLAQGNLLRRDHSSRARY
ncbi:MAG: RNA 2',3'-cyclic phosphodiesterase [Chloroflexota bacterium]